MAYINKQTAAQIRKALKEKYPKYTISVTMSNHSSINVAVIKSDLFADKRYSQVNHFNIPSTFKGKQAAFLSDVAETIKQVGGWYDKSDAMTDYFDTAFYISMSIGKWNSPHILIKDTTTLRPKFLIIGHGRHGKDTVTEYLSGELGLKFKGSSMICCENFIFDTLKDKHGYKTVEECFNDRHNHREVWHQLIADYCKINKAALGDLIFQDYDIYCGIRASDECEAIIRKYNPIVIWVDASNRLPLESEASMRIKYQSNWLRVDNNGTEDDLLTTLKTLVHHLKLFYTIHFK